MTQNMLKRLFLSVLIGLFSMSVFSADKPNILVIWGDDIGNFNISAYNRGMMLQDPQHRPNRQ